MFNHSLRSLMSSLSACTLSALALLGVAGCDDFASDQAELAEAALPADQREYIADLAWRYLNEEVDDEQSRRIHLQIDDLSPAQMRLMNKELQRLGDADPHQAQLGDRLTELAIERGSSMFAASQDDLDDVLEELGAIAVAPRALCTTWSPSPKTFLAGFNSTSSGTTAVMSDRRSTDWYEFGGCDHRFYFNGWRTLIDGKSSAYDKWIASYPSILGQHTGSGTYAVMGNGRAITSGIYSVDYSMVKAF